MIGLIHRMRHDEDGQTLILAAVAMLVLALCVMATVNIGQATYEKVKLQNAADAAAFSLATVEAEGFNFFAYTNRAILCHYAAMLTMMAYDSFVLYLDHTWVRLMAVLELVPVIGEFVAAIRDVVNTAVKIIDLAVAVMVVILGALNYAYFFFQTAMALVMEATIANPSILEQDDPDATSYDGLGVIAKVMNAAMLFKAVDLKSIEKLTTMSKKIRGNEGRKVMVDLINSTRHPWVAGVSHDSIPFGRNWRWHLTIPIPGFEIRFSFAKVSRTEDGMMAGGDAKRYDELYSVDGFQFMASQHIFATLTLKIGFTYISEVYADMEKGGHREGELDVRGRMWSGDLIYCKPAKALGIPNPAGVAICKAVNLFMKAFTEPFTLAVKALGMLVKEEEQDSHHHFFLGTTPYMKFAPEAKWRSAFNEPDFLIAASMSEKNLDKHFLGKMGSSGDYKLSWPVAGSSAGKPKEGTDAEVNFKHEKNGKSGGGLLSFLAPGFTALSAARTYYHRPGDWREQPNFFNPFWGARLEPIAAHQGVEMLKLPTVVKQFITH